MMDLPLTTHQFGETVTTPSIQEPSPLFPTWSGLDKAVQENGGVLRVEMIELRKTIVQSRLKSQVVANIQKQLANIGIGHLPENLPNSQNEHAVLYKIGEPAGAVINAVRNGANTEAAESALRQLNTSEQVKADSAKDAKLSELADKVGELEVLLQAFRAIFDEE
jgi:hypothetical protein